MMFRLGFAAIALFAVACGCGSAPEADQPWQSYELRGKIVDLRDGDPRIAYVDHEEIPGFMGAMTMGYPVRDAEEFAKLKTGDRIKATVMARGHSDYYLDDITVLDGDDSEKAAP